MNNYKIILVDDHDIVRSGLRKLIDDHKEYKVVAEADRGEEALLKAKKTDWQLMLLDLGLKDISGFDVLKRIKKDWPDKKVIVLTLYNSQEYLRNALRSKADGYMLKEDAYENLLWAIKEVKTGKRAISPKIQSTIMDDMVFNLQDADPLIDILTEKEKNVLSHVARGKTNKEVAIECGISHRTVEKHRARVMQKLNLQSTAELTQFAMKNHLL